MNTIGASSRRSTTVRPEVRRDGVSRSPRQGGRTRRLGGRRSLALVGKHTAHGAVFCTHGDVVPMLLEHYANRGVDIGAAPQWPKGSTWALDTDATGEVTAVRYLAPPPD